MTWEQTVQAYQEEILKHQLEEAKFRSVRAQCEMATANCTMDRAQLANRPSIIYGASVSRRDDVWIASAQGVYARGQSPEEALAAFDVAWRTKINNEIQNN